jgi:hypothetical protein
MAWHAPLWFLVLWGMTIYSVINGLLLGYQLNYYFKVNRLIRLCRTSIIKSAVSAFILLIMQGIFLRHDYLIEAIALKCFAPNVDFCPPLIINTTRLLAQTSAGIVIIFGIIKMIIQWFMVQAVYHINEKKLWYILLVSNAVSCTVQYLAIYPWL